MDFYNYAVFPYWHWQHPIIIWWYFGWEKEWPLCHLYHKLWTKCRNHWPYSKLLPKSGRKSNRWFDSAISKIRPVCKSDRFANIQLLSLNHTISLYSPLSICCYLGTLHSIFECLTNSWKYPSFCLSSLHLVASLSYAPLDIYNTH